MSPLCLATFEGRLGPSEAPTTPPPPTDVSPRKLCVVVRFFFLFRLQTECECTGLWKLHVWVHQDFNVDTHDCCRPGGPQAGRGARERGRSTEPGSPSCSLGFELWRALGFLKYRLLWAMKEEL